ncbi:extracellular solute-binding protein [Aliifodinibius sp. S!AR15-10]|uniref:extracellular solute-binding protein n=1 Tax=Aliifodinibius sp. S!AR15-10 TaxID=2950437 RepID=UPI0028624ECA|nr:extracellular solute-binding protein [Aliifodinibius sp. S!AR15-10]MDR8392493.1 extracellular solute-binding protein [Aliifodinibius sp. S!AR15-10]
MNIKKRFVQVFVFASIALLFASCSQSGSENVVVYSGRSRALVDDLVKKFEEKTGHRVDVRYGNDAELLAVMREEGDQSPADLFWANTTGALANANKSNMLKTLPDTLLNVPDSYASTSGKWMPITVRFRVLAYNPKRVDTADLPESVMDLPEMSQFEGRVGWTPTYSSFYDFITTMRDLEGADVTKSWLAGMQQLNPASYSSNPPMIQALIAGEIDIALTNHYYILQYKYGGAEGEYEEEVYFDEPVVDENAPVETYHFAQGDIGNLALVTGASLLETSSQDEVALEFLRFLVSQEAQSYAADVVHEYPVINTVTLPDYMLDSEKALKISPDYDYENLQNLGATLNLLREAGLI